MGNLGIKHNFYLMSTWVYLPIVIYYLILGDGYSFFRGDALKDSLEVQKTKYHTDWLEKKRCQCLRAPERPFLPWRGRRGAGTPGP